MGAFPEQHQSKRQKEFIFHGTKASSSRTKQGSGITLEYERTPSGSYEYKDTAISPEADASGGPELRANGLLRGGTEPSRFLRSSQLALQQYKGLQGYAELYLECRKRQEEWLYSNPKAAYNCSTSQQGDGQSNAHLLLKRR